MWTARFDLQMFLAIDQSYEGLNRPHFPNDVNSDTYMTLNDSALIAWSLPQELRGVVDVTYVTCAFLLT